MTPPRDLVAWPVWAAEGRALAYDRQVDRRGTASTDARRWHGEPSRRPVLSGLAAAVDAVSEVAVDDLTEPALRAEMQALQTAQRRLEARLSQAAATMSARRAKAVRAAGGDERAVDRARRQVRNEVADALKLTPSQVRQAERVGDRLAATPRAAQAFAQGDVSSRHMQILDRTLMSLSGEVRRRAEAELLEAAREQSTVEFNDTCTRLLARLDRDAAIRAEERRHGRRSASTVRRDDGMFGLQAALAGMQAEVAATAINAYRRHDVQGEHRTSEQRTADALVAALQAALDQKAAIDNGAPVQHGVRPHVIVTVDLDTLVGADGASGLAEGEWTGPMIWDRVRRVLDDAGMSFIAMGRDLPVAVTSETRNVPVGLHKALATRDRGCIHETCDMPVPWTQVMHLRRPYRNGGRLDLGSAGLGCHVHHTAFDAGRLEVVWVNERPVLHPRAGPSPPR